jgi:hypothetical protein
MASTIHLFVGVDATLTEIRKVIEAAVGASFGVNPEGELVVPFGSTRVFLEKDHEFDDQEIQWPDGTWIKLHSEYPYWVEIRDLERDENRQLEVGRYVFRALKTVGRWRLLLIYDMQNLLDQYQPQAD